MTATVAAPPTFNPFLAEFRSDPYALYRTLRTQNPIHYTLDMWVLTKYEDIIQVLNSDATSVGYIPQYVVQQDVGEIPGLVELGKKAIVFTDPPDHRRLRKLASQAFNNVNINGFKEYIQSLIASLLDPKIAEDSFDFAGVAHDIPLYTLSHFLGIPTEHIPTIDAYMHRVRAILEPSLLTKMRIRRIESDLQACLALFQQIIDYRKANLGDDLLSKLIQANVGSDRLSDSELCIACVMTYVAGHETSKGLLTNGVLALAQNPAQWAHFKQQQVTSKQLLDEVLRFDPPLQQTVRLAVSELRVKDMTIRPGDKMLLCLASANRDESKFEQPDSFRVTRNAADQIAFGHGIHNCLGQMIARLEGQLLFEYLRDRVDRFTVNEGYQWNKDGFITRTLTHLPICCQLSNAPTSRIKREVSHAH